MMWEMVLPTVLYMGGTGGVAILAVLLARMLLRRAPKLFSYLLWGVVWFRLLCPASFSSPLSAFRLADASMGAAFRLADASMGAAFRLADASVGAAFRLAGISGGFLPRYEDGLAGADETAAGMLPDMGKTQNADGSASGDLATRQTGHLQAFYGGFDAKMLFWGTIAWLSGAATMLLYGIGSMLRFRKRLVGAVRLGERIYLADYIASPFVIGIFRPRIYLPSSLSDAERGYIILHEQVHIRRKDHLVKILAFLALCIHWFNPLVWLAFGLSGRDMEMSCDEAVMEKMGPGIRAEYAASLLRLSTGRKVLAGTLAAFGEGEAGSRIRHVMRYKKPATAATVTAIAILAVTMLAVGCNPKKMGVQDGVSGQNGAEAATGNTESAKGDAGGEAVTWTRQFGLDDDFAHKMQCAFIRSMADGTLDVDLAEYIESGDTERMEELGLTKEHDMPDGYYIHNPTSDTVTWKLDSDTEYIFVDWGQDFVQADAQADGSMGIFVQTKDQGTFFEYLNTYDGGKPGMPFFFVVEGGTVKQVVEKPFA